MPNWNEVLAEIQPGHDAVRRNYLNKLSEHTGRNVIAYYSGWLSKANVAPNQLSINDEDKNGFMMAVHKLPKGKGLDLILHTPGGAISATHSIVNYLQKMFNKDIRAIVPQIAMSAGTMIACSCKEIVMAEHSNLGPIDPQINGQPAQGLMLEFKNAYDEIKKDPAKVNVWRFILQQYHPTLLRHCKHANDLSKKFVREQLADVMFGGKRGSKAKAAKITTELSSYTKNKMHDRHIHLEECKKLGLNVARLEDNSDFQDLVLTVHHCYIHTLMNSPAYKIIENQMGAALVKNQGNTALAR